VTKTTKKHGHKHTTKMRQCSTRLVSGPVAFTTTGGIQASLTRAHVIYATGKAIPTGQGRWQMMLTPNQALDPGRYTLTLIKSQAKQPILKRETITIT
jgi:hypothetical protein